MVDKVKGRKLVSYDEAVKRKLKAYYTGVPCKNNHVCPRFTRNNACVNCTTGHTVIQQQLASMARNHKAITEGTFVPPKT